MLAVCKVLALAFESVFQGNLTMDLTCDLQLLTG